MFRPIRFERKERGVKGIPMSYRSDCSKVQGIWNMID
jgi:hypothetical protein